MAAVRKQAMAHTDEEGKQWTVARPPTPFIDETGESKGWNELLDHQGWHFRAQQRKPLPTDEMTELARIVELPRGVPLPEICFGRNYLQLVLPELGIDITFNAVDALRSWNELQHELCMSETGEVDGSNYDRTFTNTYTGSVQVDPAIKRQLLRRAKLIEAPNFMTLLPTRHQIPLEQLKKRGHIFFYDEVPLYEDTMGGTGIAKMMVKLRVMEDCFLVLLRHYVLVNGKHVRLTDTRWFHSFGEPSILVDTEIREASTEALAKAAEGSRPFSASIGDKAKRDERFYLKPDQVYDLLEPKRTTRRMMTTTL